MKKDSKRKLLFLTLLLVVLMVSSAYASLVPIANAAESTVQEKTIDVLNDVVGINIGKYAADSSSQLENNFRNLPQKEVYVTLVSDQGGVRASCSFVNNILRQIYLSDYEGDLALKHPASATADMAKDFLQRYQNYASDSFYGEIASMLDNVDVNTNVTKSARNIKLEVLNSDNAIVDYVWTYTDENGIVAKSKNIILSYDQGQLKVFLNNWPLYKVVGTPKISSEEATAIAIEASKKFSYEAEIDNVTSTITGFKIAPESLGHAKLSYLNFPNQSLAREGDPLTLYPSWYVPLGFDKSYPNSVTGMTVSIWADTGEVSIMGPMVADFPSETPDEKAITDGFNLEPTTLSSLLVTAAIFSAVGVALGRRKKAKFVGSRRLFSGFWGILLCVIVLFSVIFMVTPTATAGTHLPDSKARIYAALDGGQGSPPQLQQEKDAAHWVADKLEAAYEYSGYDVGEHAGSGTVKYSILNNAYYDGQTYDNVSVFHFGHMIGYNQGYADNTGEPVNDEDIADYVTNKRYSFVFIWACGQAWQHNWGTPAAWTSRTDLSANGYTSPDGLGQAYISFDGASPIISGYHQTFEQEMTDPLKYFIESFYNYSLRIGYSIKESLNRATIDFFGTTFTSSYLNTGYDTWYDGDYWPGQMRVFGDGNMRIVQPRITLAANTPIAPTFYLDGVPHSLGDINVWPWPRQYTIEVSDVPCYEFDHFHEESLDGVSSGSWWFQPLTIPFEYSGTFTAVYTPIQQALTISSSGSGYTSPSGTQMCDPYTYKQVQAFPNSGYDHYWILDDKYAGNDDTISVYMNGPHTLQAVFYPEQDHYFVAGIESYDGPVNNPSNIAGWQNDGQYAEMQGWGPYQYYGWISGGMNKQATGHIYMYGRCTSGYPGHLYVYVSNNAYNWNLVSSPYVSSTSPYWIDCGIYQGTFNYIAVTVENPNEFVWIGIDSVRVEPIAYYDLTISSGAGGTTDPAPGTYEDIMEGTQVPVTADANDNYVFDHWLLDGNTYTQNPITVTMNDDRTLQAFFSYAPSHYWASSINDYGGPVTNPTYLLGSETDGQYAVLEGYGPYQYYGWIEATMDSQATGHIYMYGSCASGYSGHLYVYVSSNGNSWSLVGSPYVSSTSPYWIDCGTYQSTFNYIAVTVENPNEFVIIELDAVRVEP
jgi:hypothetical protein